MIRVINNTDLEQLILRVKTEQQALEDAQREVRAAERRLEYAINESHNYSLSHFVVIRQNETFFEHIADVSYPDGYYETIDEAIKEADSGPYIIYNLNAEEVKRGVK